MPAPAAIGVGVAGLGPDWPDRQRPALERLNGRVRIVAVHDAVPVRTRAAAEDLSRRSGGTTAAGGLWALARRPDVRAVLLGDPAWWGLAALDLLLRADKPVLLAGPIDPRDDRLDALAARAASAGTVVTPDLSLRFTPATLRLRELIATTLGAVHAIRVVAPLPAAHPLRDAYGQPVAAWRFAQWADWAAHLLPDGVREVVATADPAAGASSAQLRLDEGEKVTGEARGGRGAALTLASADDLAGDAAETKATVRCERGVATLSGASGLRYAVRGEPERVEDLSAERPGFDTLLTLFLRRAIGGLIPAPDLHDLGWAMALTRAAGAAAAGGEPIPISPPGGGRLRPR
ncbi:Gfo/Idh/MocA family oxidoreductase [Alienimonas californiensis]|uniref:Uncharacterized protein n=1 Tax=Alienimonas californiensis TaxID=2527989 RepID=A0A517P8E7_9PLAN|nr:hypothetical protein [Alienimonas californiensis]QDT15633.1 hypothetical protein CA12_17180 [Alienimonas californiensis]